MRVFGIFEKTIHWTQMFIWLSLKEKNTSPHPRMGHMSSLYCRDTLSLSICPIRPGNGQAGNPKIKTECLQVLD